MKTFFVWLLTSLLLLGTVSSSSLAVEDSAPKRKLKMAYTDFPPFQEDTPEGPKGLLIDLAKKYVKPSGYEIEFVYVPFKRMPSELANGNVDLWVGLTHYKEFKGSTFVGTKVVTTLELMTYALDQDISIKSLDELKKYRVITYSGYTYGGMIEELQNPKNKFQIIEVKDNDQAYRLLASKRADVLLNYRANVDQWLKENPTTQLRGHLFKALPVHVAVSRKTFEAAEILKNVESAVPTSVADAP